MCLLVGLKFVARNIYVWETVTSHQEHAKRPASVPEVYQQGRAQEIARRQAPKLVLKRVLGYVQRPQRSAIGAVVRNDYPIRYWFTIGNQQVRTEPTRYTTKAEPEPTKTYQLNRKNQIDRTNKFTVEDPGAVAGQVSHGRRCRNFRDWHDVKRSSFDPLKDEPPKRRNSDEVKTSARDNTRSTSLGAADDH